VNIDTLASKKFKGSIQEPTGQVMVVPVSHPTALVLEAELLECLLKRLGSPGSDMLPLVKQRIAVGTQASFCSEILVMRRGYDEKPAGLKYPLQFRDRRLELFVSKMFHHFY